MAKLTLLQMVTSIMSDMDSDAITSINDTPESLQVASIVQDIYFQLIGNIEVPELEQLLVLTTVGANYPNYLQIPTNAQRFNWVKYDKQKLGDQDKAIQMVRYLKPECFVELTTKRKSSDSNITYQADPTNTSAHLLIENDRAPQYYTCFDDNYLCFDSYDVAVDTTGLVGSKSIAWGQIVPVWTVSDSFIPQLDDQHFPFLLAEAKSTAIMALKQVPNAKVEKQSRFQRIMTNNDRNRSKQAERNRDNAEYAGPNFGRRNAGLWVAGTQTLPYGYRN